MVLIRQPYSVPFAEGRRTLSHIHSHIQDFTRNNSHKLSLGMANLIMQTADNISRGERLIILNEPIADTGVDHGFLVVTLQEISAGVTEHFRFEDQDAGEWNFRDFHRQLASAK